MCSEWRKCECASFIRLRIITTTTSLGYIGTIRKHIHYNLPTCNPLFSQRANLAKKKAFAEEERRGERKKTKKQRKTSGNEKLEELEED